MSEYTYLDPYSTINPLVDRNIQWLVDYLATGLNYAIGLHDSTEIAVRSTKSYDAILADLSAFPLLKAYRVDQTSDMSLTYNTTVCVSYALVLPKQDQLPGIMQWVATNITAMLTYLNAFDRGCPFQVEAADIKHEFRIME